jgi:predicted MFS family arabinose efflux permease
MRKDELTDAEVTSRLPAAASPMPGAPTSPAVPPAGERRPQITLRQTFASLQHRNYRLWFAGQGISLTGTWMQSTALGYLVFDLTRSPAYLGYVGFATGLPAWLFMLYGGVIADRVPRRKLLLVTQTAMMALAVLLMALTALRVVEPWHILAIAFALGLVNAFDAPARVSFVTELVERDDLTNAVALNASIFTAATAVGPAVSGILYAAVGPAWCFALNGLSFLAVIGALLLMRLKPRVIAARIGSARDQLMAGLRYGAGHPLIRTLLALAGTCALFGMSVVTLLPAWAVTVLGGDSTTNGLLNSARGIGALVAALSIAAWGRSGRRGRLLTLGSFVYPALLMVFSLLRWQPLSLLALMASGWGTISMLNLCNATLQTTAPDELRGRVMSLHTLMMFGLTPAGALLAGTLAENIGEPAAVFLAALAALSAAALVYWREPRVRAID